MLYEKLDYILAIAEERNLTKAAQKLYVSLPTLTVHLNRLEDQLGVKLFDRSTSPIAITPAGQFYIEKMKQIADQERAVRSYLPTIANPDRTLTIGMGMVRGQHWLPLILPAFCKKHPDMDVQLVQLPESSIAEATQQGQIDLLIGVLPNLRPDLEEEDLLLERLFLAASPDFRLIPQECREENSITNPFLLQPELLAGLPMIVPSIKLGLHKSYEVMLRQNSIQPGRKITVNDNNTGLQLAREGLGVQLVPGSLMVLNPDLQQGTLQYFVLPNMPEPRKCSAAYRKDSAKMELIQDILDIIRQEVFPHCLSIIPL